MRTPNPNESSVSLLNGRTAANHIHVRPAPVPITEELRPSDWAGTPRQ
jgi:hypothetical protein